MFEDIMKNMEKELQGQYEKVKRIDSERQMIGKRIGQLEAQIAECKVVNMELGKDRSVHHYFLYLPIKTWRMRIQNVSRFSDQS